MNADVTRADLHRFNAAVHAARSAETLLEQISVGWATDWDQSPAAAETWTFFESAVGDAQIFGCVNTTAGDDAYTLTVDVRIHGEPLDGAGTIELVNPDGAAIAAALRGARALLAAGETIG